MRRPWRAWLIGGCLGVLLLLGALCGVLGGLAVGVYQFVFNEPTVSASSLRTFAVQGAPQVVVTNPAGSVTFAPGENGAVRIEATRHARDRTGDDASKALSTITLDLRQDGDSVSIVARFSGRGSAWPGATRLVDLLITVPVRTSVTVNQSAGDATVGALTGPLSLHVDAGNIHMTDVTFTNDSQVHVGAGNVSIDGALAGAAMLDISIDAGNMTLTLPSATAAHIEAWTDAGSLTVRGWPISTHHTTGATLLAAGDTRASPQARILVKVKAGDIMIQAR
jgi:putative adhesin